MVEQASKMLRVTGSAESAYCFSCINKRRSGLYGNKVGRIANY